MKKQKQITIRVILVMVWVVFFSAGHTASADSKGTSSEPGMSASWISGVEQGTYTVIMDRITSRIADMLPDKTHISRLAIPSVKGDDGTFVDLLTEKVKENTGYHVIERRDLDQILREQGIQLNAFMDGNSLVELKKIKGVEAVILGRFKNKTVFLFWGSVDMAVKMNSVKTGDILFAKTVREVYIQPAGIYLCMAVILALVILVALFTVRKRAAKQKEKMIIRDDQAQLSLTDQLKSAANTVDKSHDALVAGNRTNLSSVVFLAKKELKTLIDKIEQSPGHTVAGVAARDKSRINDHIKKMKTVTESVTAASEKLCSSVESHDYETVLSGAETLRQEIRHCTNTFQERTAGKI